MTWNYFKYTEEDLAIPDFVGIFCITCDQEIGYYQCNNCEVVEEKN